MENISSVSDGKQSFGFKGKNFIGFLLKKYRWFLNENVSLGCNGKPMIIF